MTLILLVATFALLTLLRVSCRRARIDLDEQLCECLEGPAATAIGFGADRVDLVPAGPVLTGIDGGRKRRAPARHVGRHHLRVVEAG